MHFQIQRYSSLFSLLTCILKIELWKTSSQFLRDQLIQLIHMDMSYSLILPTLRIFSLLLSPQVTNPHSSTFRDMNFDLFHVICLEQPLLRYHSCLSVDRHTYKHIQKVDLGTQVVLGPFWLVTLLVPLGTHLYFPLGTLYLFIMHLKQECPLFIQ